MSSSSFSSQFGLTLLYLDTYLIDLVHYCLINFANLYLHLSFSLRVIEGIFIGHGVGGNLESKSA